MTPTIVFANGAWGSGLDASAVIHALRDGLPGWKFQCVALLGHYHREGDEAPPPPPPGRRLLLSSDDPDDCSLVSSFGTVMARVRATCDVRLVVTHSLGSRVAVEFMKREEGRGLRYLLVCPFLDRTSLWPMQRRLVEWRGPEVEGWVLRRLPSALTRPLLGRRFRDVPYPDGVDRLHVGTDRVLCDSRVDAVPRNLPALDLAGLSRETIVRAVISEDDPLLEPTATRSLLDRLSGAVTTAGEWPRVLPPGGGHNPMLFTPGRVAPIIIEAAR